VFNTLVNTFNDLDRQSKKIFIERMESFSVLTKHFGKYFDESKDVSKVLTSFLGVTKYVLETPGSVKTPNEQLQRNIDEDDRNLEKTFKAEFWFIHDLFDQLEEMKQLYPDNEFLKLLRPATGNASATLVREDGVKLKQKFKYLKITAKSKLKGDYLTKVTDDAKFLFDHANDKDAKARLFIKQLFYHELARTGSQFKSGSFLRYLPASLQMPLSNNIESFINGISEGKSLKEVVESTTNFSIKEFTELLYDQMIYGAETLPFKNRIKKFPYISFKEKSALSRAAFNSEINFKNEKERFDYMESEILKMFRGSGKLPAQGFYGRKFTAKLFPEGFTIDLSTVSNVQREYASALNIEKKTIEKKGEQPKEVNIFPAILSIDKINYRLDTVDNKTFVESIFSVDPEIRNQAAEGLVAKYVRVASIPNNEEISPIGYSKKELDAFRDITVNNVPIAVNNNVSTKGSVEVEAPNSYFNSVSDDMMAQYDPGEEYDDYDDYDTYGLYDDVEEEDAPQQQVPERNDNLEEEDDFFIPEEDEFDDEYVGSGSILLGFNDDEAFDEEGDFEAMDEEKPITLSTPDKPIQIYSDGSHIKGTTTIGFGAIFSHNGREFSLSGTEESQDVKDMTKMFPDVKFSNPTMEILALVKALENFKNKGEHIVINQDYKGAVNYGGLWERSEGSGERASKPWNAEKEYMKYLVNRAVKAIESIEQAGGSVKLTWVRGHSGNIMNEKADKAAKLREDFDNFGNAYKNEEEDNTPCQGGVPI
jgi:ribonuclease HI